MNVRKKPEYAEKNRIYIENLYQIKAKKNLTLESGYLNFTKVQEKNLNDLDPILMNDRSV